MKHIENCEFHSANVCTQVSEGKRAKLHFVAFDVEKHGNCAWDYVRIYEGLVEVEDVANADYLHKLCGELDDIPNEVIFPGNQGTIHFQLVYILAIAKHLAV
jgi:hypothetical protein